MVSFVPLRVLACTVDRVGLCFQAPLRFKGALLRQLCDGPIAWLNPAAVHCASHRLIGARREAFEDSGVFSGIRAMFGVAKSWQFIAGVSSLPGLSGMLNFAQTVTDRKPLGGLWSGHAIPPQSCLGPILLLAVALMPGDRSATAQWLP